MHDKLLFYKTLFINFLLTNLLQTISHLCKNQVYYLSVLSPYQLLFFLQKSLLYFVLQLHLFPIFIPSWTSFMSFLILSKEPPVSWGKRVAVLFQSSILLCCTDLFICFTLSEICYHILASWIYSPLVCDAGLLFALSAENFLFYAGKTFSGEKNLT